MQATKLLLEKKVRSLPKSKRKDFLINCIQKNNVIKIDNDESLDLQTQTISVDKSSFCQICNKYNFIRDNYSETCQSCGFERKIMGNNKTFEKIEYIKPGSNLVKIYKDSKKITVDLNKIDQWMQDTDPLAKDTQKILENLNIIFQSKGIDLPNNVKNNAVSLWYNFNSLYSIYNGSLKKFYNKRAIMTLCVYYSCIMHGYTVSLEQLSILFTVNVSDIYTTNTLIKEIFKDTEYYKYMNLHDNKLCEIKLSPKNKLILKKIEEDLKKYFPNFPSPIQNKELAGIVYFITNKINPVIKFTLKDLEEKCNISTTSISTISKSIEKFYKNNPKLYKELII